MRSTRVAQGRYARTAHDKAQLGQTAPELGWNSGLDVSPRTCDGSLVFGGQSLGETPVPADIHQHVSVSGASIVYRTGTRIWMMDGLSGRSTLIATAAGTPIGLSIEGWRVAWAENVGGRGRIVTLTVH